MDAYGWRLPDVLREGLIEVLDECTPEHQAAMKLRAYLFDSNLWEPEIAQLYHFDASFHAAIELLRRKAITF